MQAFNCQPETRQKDLQLTNSRSLLTCLLPPQACLGCRTPVYRELALCEDCESELPWQPPGCEQCGLSAGETLHVGRCFHCQQSPPAFDHCHSVFAYEHPVADMIRRFKDHGVFAPARCLATLLAAAFRQYYLEQGLWPDMLAPVPLHNRKIRTRGFNQSVWMARFVHRRTGVPLSLRACVRRATPHSQRGLRAQARKLNMQDVFCAGADADLTAGRHIAIIDDVVTTTATANAMSQVLRQHGAARIDVWALARVN